MLRSVKPFDVISRLFILTIIVVNFIVAASSKEGKKQMLLKSSINANSVRGCETTSSNFSPFSRLFYSSCEFMATQSLATDSIPNGRKEEERAPELRNCLRTAPCSFRFSGRANLLRDFMFSYLGDCNITIVVEI